jgi:phosphatidylserine decarboxylase
MKLAREGWVPVALLALVAGGGAWAHPAAGAALLPLVAFALWFFRDPEREQPDEDGVLLAPADGRILVASPSTVSIFMNVFDVHVCRTPIAGRVEEVTHTPGRFIAAYREAASEQNERVSIVVSDGRARVRFTLVAGLIARRIVCRVHAGQELAAGQRVGMIRFGSRVDVRLPAGASVAVVVGQRVVAGQTPIARRMAATGGPGQPVPGGPGTAVPI